jgi:uncharacterized protein (DUF1800 family)
MRRRPGIEEGLVTPLPTEPSRRYGLGSDPATGAVGVVAASTLLSACAGGDASLPTAFDRPETALHQPALLGLPAGGASPSEPWARPRAQAVASAAPMPTPTANDLFDWAERTFPALFPGPSPTQASGAYVFRHYPGSGQYLAVAGEDAYVLGPLTGNALVRLGTLGDFAPLVLPATGSVSDADAARFLLQAQFSASTTEIAAVKARGYASWLDEQFAMPQQGTSRVQWMTDNGHAAETNVNSFAGADAAIWRKLIASPDAVRQRMTLALSEILVVSMNGLPIAWRNLAIAHYVDLLERHAFGNFRDLLQDVTLSAAMGTYLNMNGNRKEDTRTGRVPDENYAREVMQLFTIGLLQLNADGSVRTGAGGALETYTQTDITQLARVFTGWVHDRATGVAVAADTGYVARPMRNNGTQYQPGDKTVLGTTIPGTATPAQALGMALDILFRHPNVGPFIGRQLIQRFTSSHPSPSYVARVAAAFDDNGSGVRGDLKAVLRAVLLDNEARAAPSGPYGGRLREPIQRLVQWARTFGAVSASDRWAIGDLSDPGTRLGQSPLRSPSVFNFFRPGYVPPGNELAARGITAPEFQLVNESTVAGYLNFMQTAVASGLASGDIAPGYAAELALANDPGALLRHLNLRLAGNGLADTTISALTSAVTSIAATTDAGRLARVRAAVLLVMAAPEYLVQR